MPVSYGSIGGYATSPPRLSDASSAVRQAMRARDIDVGHIHVILDAVTCTSPTSTTRADHERRRWSGYGVRAASIWSKSPTPLRVPPPPDHCHISAYLLALV